MNPNEPGNHDESLTHLLREWKDHPPLPPRFQEAVWQRIARAQAQVRPGVWHTLVAWVEAALNRPALAVSYIAVLLVSGLGAGYWQAQDKSAEAQSQWRTAYVQSVDPYQTPRN